MVPEAYVKGIRLDEPGVKRLNPDKPPLYPVQYLPVYENNVKRVGSR